MIGKVIDTVKKYNLIQNNGKIILRVWLSNKKPMGPSNNRIGLDRTISSTESSSENFQWYVIGYKYGTSTNTITEVILLFYWKNII